MLASFAPDAIAQTARCEGLADLKLPTTTIATAQSVAAGAFVPASGSATPFKSLPAFCRVTGVNKPTSDSEIKFEVWMPAANWNGKFQGVGNGGFAGSIGYGGLGAPWLAATRRPRRIPDTAAERRVGSGPSRESRRLRPSGHSRDD